MLKKNKRFPLIPESVVVSVILVLFNKQKSLTKWFDDLCCIFYELKKNIKKSI